MLTSVFWKKLFGTRYEKILRNIIVSIAVAGGLYGAEIKLQIASFFVFLMTVAITITEMKQSFGSDDNSQNMKNLIMMPFDSKKFILAYVSSLGLYTFICRTLPVLAAVFAISGQSTIIIVNTALWIINATLLSAVIIARKKIMILTSLFTAGVFALNFWIGETYLYSGIIVISIIIAFVLLITADPYAFYIDDAKKGLKVKGRSTASVWSYIFRYIIAHKNYITNTIVFWVIAAIYPVFSKEMIVNSPELGDYVVLLGFAIISMNTPIGIIISSDRSLEQAMRVLPGQKRKFFVPYCGFIFASNTIPATIYLISCQLMYGNIQKTFILAAVFFAMQNAIIAVLLEWFAPIRNWKVENDLWHHPRKYIVPGVTMVFVALIGSFPVVVYGLIAALLVEIGILLYSANK